jgi:hypothetical protein
MIKSGRKLSELAAVIEKGSNITITKKIKMLREEQPFEGVIGLLATLYNKNHDPAVRKSIEEFMNDLKDRSLQEEVMIEIRKPWKAETITMLVSSCWQSGLNYSDYSLDIADLFLKGDYSTAIECMTVIEESLCDLSSETKNEIIRSIEEFPVSPVDEKSALFQELIAILRR